MKTLTHRAGHREAPLIDIQAIKKAYAMGETTVHALRGVSLTMYPGEYVAIVGSSGSGKSTLMNMIGLLDRPSEGSYCLRGTEVSRMNKAQLANLRNQEIGFIFQRFHLLPRTSAQRQVELPLFYGGVGAREAARRALASLQQVGHHHPEELSGGQQQRVAIARALVNQPSLLLADEPTGALDSKTGSDVMQLFDSLHQQGLTLIVVTHDMKVARRAERIVTLSDGRIVSDEQLRSH
jgi:putative ABC transport system ATP-binding protein